MKEYSHKAVPVSKLLSWAGLQPSGYYYKKSGLPRGRKRTTHSINQEGQLIENAEVVKDIEQTLSQEFCCYGYHQMTGELKERGWIINHKKVYWPTKDSKLLYGARFRPAPFKRNFIRFRTVNAERPLQYLAMDIKYLDDIKSTAGDIYTPLKKILDLPACGNAKEAFLRDTLCPLITQETQIFTLLEKEIFGLREPILS